MHNISILIPWIIAGLLFCAAVISILLLIRKQKITREHYEQLFQERAARLEQQTELARAAAKSKSDFLSKMSHEIRTPLNAIIGMAHLARKAETPEKSDDYIRHVEENSKHLLGIVNDILDFSKMESGNLVLEERLFYLPDNLRFIMAMFQEQIVKKGLDFQVDFDKIRHKGIVSDSLRLNQVLINLLSNAVKFTEQGTITLSVEELAYQDGQAVFQFVIEDTGVGIEREYAKRLFTPFTQANSGISRQYGGTGLGLVISKNIVEMMGGEMQLETEPGQGSRFLFTIRVEAQLCDGAAAAEGPCMMPQLRGRRIMIVDDIEVNRLIISELLKGSGAELMEAADGREACALFEASEPGYYDLVFMDIQMPVMDGIAATKAIRGSQRGDAETVRIIAMTANALAEDVKIAYTSGVDDYLTKPVEVDTLYRKLGDLF